MEQVPVSIIIVVQDVASILLKTLPKLLNQQYSKFELVVVDNNSQDETRMLLLEYSHQFSNLKIVDLDSAVTSIRGRKFAISMGIRCASYDHLLFTDAECCPTSSHWLEKMSRNFVSRTSIVLGYSTFEKKRNPFNRLLHFDNMFNAMQFFGHAIIKSAYRGDGKNMAYAKPLFYAQRGFASHNHICYGDEDIFISRASNKNNTAIEYSQDAFTVLQRGAYHKYWLHHKEGLYYTRKFNTLKNRILLNGFDLIHLLFYIVLVIAILLSLKNMLLLTIVLSIAGFRILCQYFIYGFGAKKLNEKQVIPFLLIYDIIFALLNPFYHLSARINQHRFL
ncbi:MAG: glycosyltransferase [Bacteroidales bacterium]|nr:glycosyltransferase [Bacteroidales bacterium]